MEFSCIGTISTTVTLQIAASCSRASLRVSSEVEGRLTVGDVFFSPHWGDQQICTELKVKKTIFTQSWAFCCVCRTACEE